jgi:hypothetical protein
MSDDYTRAANLQYNNLLAQRQRAQADLAEYKVQGDDNGMANAIQTLSDVDCALSNLSNLYSRYQQSQQPRYAPYENDQEKLAKPVDKMTWGDVYEISRNSKYGVNDEWFRAGMNEIRRNPTKRG